MRSRPAAHALHGLPRAVAHGVHATVVPLELAYERLLDSFGAVPPDDRSELPVTAVIKTFERPRIVARLVRSIRRLYPRLPIVVVDDSREPARLPSVTTVAMPYDSGIAAGRNEGVDHAQTPYVLVLDDDFVFTRHTRLGPALALMERHPEIDIMGGRLAQLPAYEQWRVRPGEIFDVGRTPRLPLGSIIGGLEVVDKVQQFMLARREALQRVKWDPRLKRADHADFFTRALGELVTVFNPDLRALHVRTPFDRAYMAKRLDLADSFGLLQTLYPNGYYAKASVRPGRT